jgi:hypothetical protein
VRCCSGLHKLLLIGIIHEGTHVSPLLQLPCCKHLVVVGPACTDSAVATVLAQLTQLTYLEMRQSLLTCVGLDSWTALTGWSWSGVPASPKRTTGRRPAS